MIHNRCLPALLLIIILLSSCNSSERGKETAVDTTLSEGEFHADNDIAMTVRSLMDALSVGEALDSAQYTFNGVMTDGSGRPIYIDTQGAPGTWEVKVLNSGSAMVRNLSPGDLVPDALIRYLIDNTDLKDENKIKEGFYDDKSAGNVIFSGDFTNDPRTEVECYTFNGCVIRFETRQALTTGGIESPLLTIDIHRIEPIES
ncbi:MAG: hypothetical protein K2N03_07680 [Muribaculaceae bacterium]|nr:hypothetical protein [Muribaculaceae bacterium]